jgi:hypothetical protein
MTAVKHLSAACSFALLTCVVVVSAASGHAQSVYIGTTCQGCASRPLAEHPGKLVVTPAAEVRKIRWTHWGARTATGRGTYLATTGVSEPATLVASQPVQCGGHEVYSRLAWRTTVFTTPAGKHFRLQVPFNRSRCEFVP